DQVRVAEDRRHRRPDLVARVGEELRLDPRGPERRVARLHQLLGEDSELRRLVLRQPARVLRFLVIAPVVLLDALALGDVPREAARVDEPSAVAEDVHVDQYLLPRSVLAAEL